MTRNIYTSSQAAKVCGVSPQTVNRWIDSGLLNGHRIPGSRHRRVSREDLARFLAENGMPPIDGWEEDRP